MTFQCYFIGMSTYANIVSSGDSYDDTDIL
jgi:hypothetical protein